MVDPDPLLATPSETARFIAAAHTVFNILLALAIIPISGRFAGLVRRVSRRGALLPR
jgi:Na+/phosphate symporter